MSASNTGGEPSARPTSHRRRTALLLLALILVPAMVLRARGLDYLLPQVINRDGMVHVRQLEKFQGYQGDPQAELMLAINPHLLSRLGALGPAVPAPEEVGSLSLEEALELCKVPWMNLRIASLLLSPVVIVASYLLARRFLDRGGSVFAAGLVATSLLNVLPSAQEKGHSAVTAFLLLSLLFAMRIRRRGDALSYVLFGIATALTLGTLHHGLMCIPVLAVAWLLRERPATGAARRASSVWLLAPLALFAASLALFWPFLADIAAGRGAAQKGRESPTVMFLRVFTPGEYDLGKAGPLFREVWNHDPVLVSAAFAGVLWLGLDTILGRVRIGRALRGDFAVLLAYAIPYSVPYLFIRSANARYTAELIPVLAIAGGYAFSRIAALAFARLGTPALRGAAALVLGGAVLAVPFAPAWRLGVLRTRTDTLEECARWIAANVPPSENVVVVGIFDLPLVPTAEALAENASQAWRTAWAEFLSRGYWEKVAGPRFGILVQPGPRQEARGQLRRDPAAYLARWNARYVVLSTPIDPTYASVRGWLKRNARRLARFSPLSDDDGERAVYVVFHNEPLDPSTWTLLDCRTLGPTVEVYQLP